MIIVNFVGAVTKIYPLLAVILNLVDLQAVETINIIERAFQSHQVDTLITGYWEDIQVEFGLTRYGIPYGRFSDNLSSLFSSTQPTKAVKGFGSNQSNTKKKKPRKSGKRKK